MAQEIIIAGFGGQGVMSMGMLLTYAGMLEGQNVSWLPSYGPEMRGGTANCSVILSHDLIGSPVVTDATGFLAMNAPSLDKFEDSVMDGGLLIINKSLIKREAKREDLDVCYIPANEIADELGNSRVANMVMLGAYLEKTKAVSPVSVLDSLREVLGASKEHLIPLNGEALRRGAELVK